MIEKMKKLTFLVYHREYEEFLHRLQELGVMHIEGGALAEGQSDAVSADMAELRRVDALLKQMENLPADKKSAEPQAPDATSADRTLSSDSIATLESLFARQADLASREKELGRVRSQRGEQADGCCRLQDAFLHSLHQSFQEGDCSQLPC